VITRERDELKQALERQEENYSKKEQRNMIQRTDRTRMKKFEEELAGLINSHSIENLADMPDFMLAGMLCRMIDAIGPSIKRNLDWHGCDSVCHPAAADGENGTQDEV